MFNWKSQVAASWGLWWLCAVAIINRGLHRLINPVEKSEPENHHVKATGIMKSSNALGSPNAYVFYIVDIIFKKIKPFLMKHQKAL